MPQPWGHYNPQADKLLIHTLHRLSTDFGDLSTTQWGNLKFGINWDKKGLQQWKHYGIIFLHLNDLLTARKLQGAMTMTTLQEIAQATKNPADEWRNRHLGKMAPGKAQQIILDALGIEAENYAHAEEIFKALGIGVVAVRAGRRSVPRVGLLNRAGGATNKFGEGEEWEAIEPPCDLSAIAEWIS